MFTLFFVIPAYAYDASPFQLLHEETTPFDTLCAGVGIMLLFAGVGTLVMVMAGRSKN